jgi:hypothetical protein
MRQRAAIQFQKSLDDIGSRQIIPAALPFKKQMP